MGHPASHGREPGQGVAQAQVRVAREQRHANFVAGHGRDIELAAFAPMQLHQFTPRLDAIVGTEAVAAAIVVRGVQTSPPADARVAAVGSHDPTGGDFPAGGRHRFPADGGHRRTPCQTHTGVGGDTHHVTVQGGSAHAESIAGGEAGFGRNIAVAEPDTGKAERRRRLQIDTQRTGGPQPIRHHAFAAGLVDGRKGAVGDSDVETAAARGNGGGEASRASADYEDIRGTRKRHAVRYLRRGARFFRGHFPLCSVNAGSIVKTHTPGRPFPGSHIPRGEGRSRRLPC